MKKNYKAIALVVWALVIVISFGWNYKFTKEKNVEVIKSKAKASFDQIQLTRAWNASHNGVYVPVSETTQPNPYLNDTLRDIYTDKGINLTKINPAYMTRQIAEINSTRNELQFHITSLNPIRPKNKADHWEENALETFEKGNNEVFELVKNDSAYEYRYMAPLITEKSCLQCHAVQGYRVGDVRGGISVSFPALFYRAIERKQILVLLLIHLFFLVVGLVGIKRYFKVTRMQLKTIHDKTHEMEIINEVLQKNNESLQNINHDKDILNSLITHDLKTPIISISGFSDLLRKKIEEKDIEKSIKYSDIIYQSSKRLVDLIDNLSIWTRLQSESFALRPEPFNLTELVQETIELLKYVAFIKSIKLTQNLNNDIKVYADRETIYTVLRNLISNAIKFTQEQGEISIFTRFENKYAIIAIKDNGIGMPLEKTEKIFQRHNDAISTPGTNNEKGTGLGLFICKEFIERNNGKIWVESEMNTGTTFYFSIPLEDIEK